jgi:hypothetical protein
VFDAVVVRGHLRHVAGEVWDVRNVVRSDPSGLGFVVVWHVALSGSGTDPTRIATRTWGYNAAPSARGTWGAPSTARGYWVPPSATS